MDLTVFEKIDRACAENLADTVNEILSASKSETLHAIGFITVDDFYGFYLCWDYQNSNVYENYDWKQSLDPDFLYQPLVDAVDACKDIDFLTASDEKWGFAEALLKVLEKNIKQIPNEVFQKNGYRREEILFFATMADGDYVQEMLDASIQMFNAPETIEAYGPKQ